MNNRLFILSSALLLMFVAVTQTGKTATSTPSTEIYTTGPGSCGINGCFPMYYTDGTVLESLWIHVASPYSQPAPSNNYVFWGGEPLCQGTWTISWPTLSVSPSNPGPAYGHLTGSCTGVDSAHNAYTLSYTQYLRAVYSRGGGGKGGGGAGVHVNVVNGSFTVTY